MRDNDQWESANLVLLQSFVDSVRRRLVRMLDDKLLSQSSFGLMQPGAHCIQGGWQRPVQVKVPIQELQ